MFSCLNMSRFHLQHKKILEYLTKKDNTDISTMRYDIMSNKEDQFLSPFAHHCLPSWCFLCLMMIPQHTTTTTIDQDRK